MKFFKPKKIDLTQQGLAKVLGELEAAILECMWEHGHTTARDICDCLNSERSLSFNAVNTVLNRMVEKKLLHKKKDNSYYYYMPAKSKDAFAEMMNTNVFSSLLDDKHLFSIASFAQFVKSLPADQRKSLKKLLDEL